jgi:hypothetical protein
MSSKQLRRVSGLLGLAACSVLSLSAQQPLHLSAEGIYITHPYKLPTSVLSVLGQDPMVANIAGSSQPPSNWFSSEKLKPVSSDSDLYVIQGLGPISGANVTTFWVVRDNRKAHQAEVLWNGAEHDLSLRYEHGDPYPVLETTSMSAVHLWEATFRYNGSKYVLEHKSDQDLK